MLQKVSLTLAMFFAVQSITAAHGKSQVYRLDQLNRSAGRQTVLISDDAIKVQQPGGTRVTVMRAPAWKPIVINTASKSWYQAGSSSSQGLLVQRVMLFEGANHSKYKWVPVEYGTIAGIPAARYADAQLANKWKFNPKGFNGIADEMRENGVWVARDAIVSARAANALAHIHGLPQVGRIPLRFIHFSYRNRIETKVVDTFSVSTAGSISGIDIPANFKRSLNEFDNEKAGQGLLDELLQSSNSSRDEKRK
jgi:hypothetical protein